MQQSPRRTHVAATEPRGLPAARDQSCSRDDVVKESRARLRRKGKVDARDGGRTGWCGRGNEGLVIRQATRKMQGRRDGLPM
jgi:hypothetical protein